MRVHRADDGFYLLWDDWEGLVEHNCSTDGSRPIFSRVVGCELICERVLERLDCLLYPRAVLKTIVSICVAAVAMKHHPIELYYLLCSDMEIPS